MELHRVRRLIGTLLTSQVRSARTSSDTTRWTGRPIVFAVLDVAAFLVALGGAFAVVPALSLDRAGLAGLANGAMPFVPLLAAGGVVIAGLMFELTSTARFTGSDTVNWLPLTPGEYVAASSTAIAFAYSLPVALFLGALLPLALAGGVLPAYALTGGLALMGLYQGAALIEMVRAGLQRAGSVGSGRRGGLLIVVRAAVLVVVFVAFDAAFNPILLLGFLQAFGSVPLLGAVPLFWSTEAITHWTSGALRDGLAYAAGQAAFVVLLLYLAVVLRGRFWVPSPGEASERAAPPSDGHPVLAALGLSAAEAAVVSKDLRAYVRRRDLLPILILPIVVVVLFQLQGVGGDPTGSLIVVGWISGFFTILLATVSIGQERRSIAWLYAFPLSVRNVLRAKAAGVLLPSFLWTTVIAVGVGIKAGAPVPALLAMLPILLAITAVLGLWGLVFAVRYSDFQDRPRAQFMRPLAMFGTLGSGIVVLFALLLPATFAILSPSAASVPLLAASIVGAGAIGALAVHWTRTGLDALLRELPF